MVIFRSRCTDYNEIIAGLYSYMGCGQIIRLFEGKYYQANLVDVLPTSSSLRIITLRVEGYRELSYTTNNVDLCVVMGGLVDIRMTDFKIVADYSQIQKLGRGLDERTKLYCIPSNQSVFFLKANNPLCLIYNGNELEKSPTRALFNEKMRGEPLGPAK